MRRPLGPRCAGFLTVDPVGLLDAAADLGFRMGEADGDLALQHTDAAAEIDKLAQVFRMAGRFCRRKSAMVL